MGKSKSRFFNKAAVFTVLIVCSTCQLYAGLKLQDSDGNGIPDGYKIKSLKSAATIKKGGADGEDSVEISSLGENSFTRVYFPVPETINKTKNPEYYLFVFQVKLDGGAEAKGFAKTTEGESTGSQQFKYMPWKDSDVSVWTKIRTPIELKPGDSVKKIYANISFKKPEAKAWVGAHYLEKVPEKRFKAVGNPKKWEMLADNEITPAMSKDIKKGNMVKNSSFELGSAGYSYPYDIYKRLKHGDAVDGNTSLSFPGNTLMTGMVESLFYRINPGKLYTFSAYLKGAKPDTRVSMRVLSGYQWSDRVGGLTGDRPVAIKRVKVGPEWTRVHFSFIPEYASKSCCKIYISGTNFLLDAIQLEEGPLTDYKPDKKFDIGIHRAPGNDFAIYKLGEKVPYTIEIDSLEKSLGELKLKYVVTDYWDKEVISREETVDLAGKRKTNHKADFVLPEPGTYKLRVECENPAGGEKIVSESRIFGVLPKDIPEEVVEPSYFGTHIFYPREMPAARKAGMGWIRLWDSNICKFKWARAEKEKGKVVYNEKGLQKCYDAGFKILGTISHPAPSWLQKQKGDGKDVLKDIPAFKKFVFDTVTRFKDKIKYWEVLNEPYFTYSSKEYAEILKIGYAEIKRADPDAVVVGICCFMLPGYYTEWLEGILKEVGTDYMDVVSTHAYIRKLPEFAEPSYTERMKILNALLEKYGKKKLEIWDTESVAPSMNFYRDRLPGADTKLTRQVNPEMSYKYGANWLVRHRIIGIANNVTKSFYYAMQYVGSYGHRQFNSSLLEYTQSPHSTLMVQAVLSKEINAAKYTGEVSLCEKTRCYTFQKGETPLCVMWRVSENNDPTEDDVILKGDVETLDFINIMGGKYLGITKRDKSRIEFKISGEPVYIKAPGMTLEKFKELLGKAKIISSEKLKASAFGVRLGDDSGKMYVQVKNVSTNPEDALIKLISKPESWKAPDKSSLKEIAPGTVKSVDIPIENMNGKGEIKARVSTLEAKSPCEVKAYPRKCLKAAPAAGKIVMDGSFEDWPESQKVEMSAPESIKNGADKWDGKDDLSATFSLCYDKENLYFAIQVKDDKIVVEGMGPSGRNTHKLYKGDCVELFFEPGIRTSITNDIYQFFFVTSCKEQNLPAVCKVFMRNKIEEAEIVSIEKTGGYDLELKLPRATLNIPELEKGYMMGFDVTINDRDSSASSAKSIAVWSGTTKNHNDASQYGVLLLK